MIPFPFSEDSKAAKLLLEGLKPKLKENLHELAVPIPGGTWSYGRKIAGWAPEWDSLMHAQLWVNPLYKHIRRQLARTPTEVAASGVARGADVQLFTVNMGERGEVKMALGMLPEIIKY